MILCFIHNLLKVIALLIKSNTRIPVRKKTSNNKKVFIKEKLMPKHPLDEKKDQPVKSDIKKRSFIAKNTEGGNMPLTLNKMNLIGEIDIHSDILSIVPSALSTKRAHKVGAEKQKPMKDEKGGPDKCILCNPGLRPKNRSELEKKIIPKRVAGFKNDYPYLPMDQWVIFLWHRNYNIRKRCFHKFQLGDIRALELYWLIKACLKKGNEFEIPKESTDTWRMVVGINIGKLAGQSIPHFHVNYGWEVALNPKNIPKEALALYFKEIEEQGLIIYRHSKLLLVAPWTPKGQHAIELYFNGKYDFRQMNDEDVKIFAVFGEEIIKKYLQLGIENVNIVFTNSPLHRETEPLTAHFVPRVNMAALYEIKGVNVVDTPPVNIAAEFTRYNDKKKEGVRWADVYELSRQFDPDKKYEDLIKGRK